MDFDVDERSFKMIDNREVEMIKILETENKILQNDMIVFRTIIKQILSSNVTNINGMHYFNVSDIIEICNNGFKSLSSEIKKEENKMEKKK